MATAEVIPLFETAQSMDASYAPGWVELGRLYQEAGRLADAQRAAEQALAQAQDDRQRSVATTEIADVLVARGNLAAAQARFEEGLALDQHAAQLGPSSAEAQRDVSVSLSKLGDVLLASGILPGRQDLEREPAPRDKRHHQQAAGEGHRESRCGAARPQRGNAIQQVPKKRTDTVWCRHYLHVLSF
jgi:tetratricopeptide (TPR) repeat protein